MGRKSLTSGTGWVFSSYALLSIWLSICDRIKYVDKRDFAFKIYHGTIYLKLAHWMRLFHEMWYTVNDYDCQSVFTYVHAFSDTTDFNPNCTEIITSGKFLCTYICSSLLAQTKPCHPRQWRCLWLTQLESIITTIYFISGTDGINLGSCNIYAVVLWMMKYAQLTPLHPLVFLLLLNWTFLTTLWIASRLKISTSVHDNHQNALIRNWLSFASLSMCMMVTV